MNYVTPDWMKKTRDDVPHTDKPPPRNIIFEAIVAEKEVENMDEVWVLVYRLEEAPEIRLVGVFSDGDILDKVLADFDEQTKGLGL